jgi:hypothetical protein
VDAIRKRAEVTTSAKAIGMKPVNSEQLNGSLYTRMVKRRGHTKMCEVFGGECSEDPTIHSRF